MSDYRERLYTEFNQLGDKLEKLKIFILSDKYDELPEIDRKDLKEQLVHMTKYHEVLSKRVSRCCNNS